VSDELELERYLTEVYRRDILGESLGITMPAVSPASVKAEIARIDSMRLGANLANRDFVSFQNRRALVQLLKELEAQKSEDAAD
jgi:hypothetical protein